MGEVIVRTTSNKKFICDLGNEKECWAEIDYEPFAFGKVLCFMEDCSDNHTLQIIKATGQSHNFGELSFVYFLNDSGTIYVKETGFVYPEGYMMGAILGGFCAFVAFVGKHLILGVIPMFKRN